MYNLAKQGMELIFLIFLMKSGVSNLKLHKKMLIISK